MKFTVTIEASALYAVDQPTMQIVVNGSVYTYFSVSQLTGSSTGLYSYTIESATFPSSLAFAFNDGSAEGGRSISIHTARINDQQVDTTYISALVLSQTQSSSVTVAALGYLFGSSEPTTTDVGTPTITGTPAADDINGTSGNDIIDAGTGDDRVTGRYGEDAIFGGDGNDTLLGNEDNDVIVGGLGDDLISGDAGDDLIYGGAGNDTLIGGLGLDVIWGGADNDNILGGDGNDILYGEAGNDTLYGEAGNDLIYGSAGDDIMDGGTGIDTISYATATAGVTVNLTTTTAQNTVGQGTDTLTNFEIIEGSKYADTLTGTSTTTSISGGAGNDILTSGSVSTVSATISSILAANAGVIYDSTTGNFYKYVNSNVVWNSANNTATTSLINGVAGHLVQITSAYENSMIDTLTGTNDAWMGANDVTTEGT